MGTLQMRILSFPFRESIQLICILRFRSGCPVCRQFPAGQQAGGFPVPLDQCGICQDVQAELFVIDHRTVRYRLVDPGRRAVGAGCRPAQQCVVAVHTRFDAGSQFPGPGVEILQLIGVRVDDIDPGILVVQDAVQFLGLPDCQILLLLFQQEF